MKKILMLTILAISVLSCGTPKTVIASKKVIKGNWSLDKISYSESGTFNVKLLNDASSECFEGSTWKFVSNNNEGIYTINNNECNPGERFFNFTIQEMNSETGLYDFLIKPTNEKHKSPDGNGFRLQLTNLSDSNMQWQQTVNLDGKPFIISMNFSKIIE